MRTSLAALVLSFAFAQPSLGGDQGSVVGTWKLVSYEVEAQASGERGPVMGQSPTGYASFLPEGRVFFMLTGEARKPGKTDRERADLLSTLVAYTGTYRLDGDKWTTSASRWPGTRSGSAPSRSVPSSSKASACKS
jgi:Lipocalin-like domain